MHDSPSVSVVVPFFNRSQSLAACVEALLGQEPIGGAVQIILVDNGSNDDSRSVIARYPELTVLAEATPGAYAARNTGIREARAPIIAFTDADCVVERDWLRAVCDGMRDPSVAVEVGACRYPSNASLTLKLLAAYENAKAEYVATHCAPKHHFAYANNMAVRASVLAELGPFLEWDRAADTEFVHRVAARRADLRLIFNPAMRVTHLEFVRFRDRAGRLSLYTQTNSRIASFRELTLRHRAGVVGHLARGFVLGR
jgi:glycosyltransferase involved in cell wall biosynthesis